jgi:hypothetical protein
MHTSPSLVLPYLDREFQVLADIREKHIDWFSKYALISCPTVIASPDFIIESPKVRGSIITSEDFYGTDHIKLSMRDATVPQYRRRKQELYDPVRDHYPEYFDSLDKFLHGLNFPVRRRNFEIVEKIKGLWNAAACGEGQFSFSHMAMEVPDKKERDDILAGLRSVPFEIKNSPFVWENVCRIMDRNVPTWGNTNLKHTLRNFLLKAYFEALCEPGDSVVAFSDFPVLGIADSSLTVSTVPLAPIKKFLAASKVLDFIHTMPVVKFIEVISSRECEYFRIEYIKFVQMLRTQTKLEKYDPEEFPYEQAVQLSNRPAPWILRALKRAGAALSGAKMGGEIRPLLERAAARGFVRYIEQVQDEQLELFRKIRPIFSLPRSGEFPITIHVGDNNYFVKQAAAVGSGAVATGNILNQTETKVDAGIDITALMRDLEVLILAMRKTAKTPEEDAALGHIVAAQIECKSGNLQKALEYLKSAGKWAFEQATAVGVETASAVLRKKLGLEP